MTSSKTTKQLSPGQTWLGLNTEEQIAHLQGLIEGLNQGLRHCSLEVAFSLSTRVTKDLTPENKLALESITQQMRTWGKSGVSIFKYSKPIESYAECLSVFYRRYSKYEGLPPAYLMVYMDDHHGMGPADLYSLHEHSLQGFKR